MSRAIEWIPSVGAPNLARSLDAPFDEEATDPPAARRRMDDERAKARPAGRQVAPSLVRDVGDGPFPERIHVNALLVTLMVEQARMASRWAAWAKAEVERWSDAATPDVEWAVQALRRVVDAEPFSDAP